MTRLVVVPILLAWLAMAPTVRAQDAAEDRDAAIFGGDEPVEDATPAAPPPGGADRESSRRDDALFGGDDGGDGAEPGLIRDTLGLAGRLEELDDLLQIGGQLWLRLDWYPRRRGEAGDWRLSSPNLLDLYLDVRPNDRIRAYAQGRLTHQFGDPGADPVSGTPHSDTAVALDQLWLKFDIGRYVFVTAGRQPVRWGVGRLWNPTDFLNQDFKDPLAVFDARLGRSLVKIHVPVESLNWNFYAVADIEGVGAIDEIGLALRAEMLFGATELTASFATRKEQPYKLGTSLSTAISVIDLSIEAALLHDVRTPYWTGAFDLDTGTLPTEVDRSDEWFARAVANAEIGIGYGDDDALYLGAEYAYNGLGYDDGDLYTWFFARQAFAAVQGESVAADFVPFYTGKHYAAVYLFLPAPGRLDDASFNLTTVGNLSDLSLVSRLDFRIRLLTYLDLNAYAAVHYGKRGEFRMSFDALEGDDIQQLEDGLYSALFDLGLGLRVAL